MRKPIGLGILLILAGQLVLVFLTHVAERAQKHQLSEGLHLLVFLLPAAAYLFGLYLTPWLKNWSVKHRLIFFGILSLHLAVCGFALCIFILSLLGFLHIRS